MSTLAVGTIKSVSSAAPVFQNTSGTEKGQLAKAWVLYDGTTDTVLDSFNVSSVTRHSAGQYTVNFSNSFSSTNYCAAPTCPFFLVGNDVWVVQGLQNNRLTGSCRFWTNQATNTFDSANFGVVFFGDN
tara:strand:- start:152 stop:538 length:387 start_codon:yes stop_codon:yes gene_type:complete